MRKKKRRNMTLMMPPSKMTMSQQLKMSQLENPKIPKLSNQKQNLLLEPREPSTASSH